jgi:flagellar biosynthesis/type III secretory pathway protein FliH
MQTARNEGRREGRAEGLAEGLAERDQEMIDLIKQGYTAEQLMELLSKRVK